MMISKHQDRQKILRNVVRACQDLLMNSDKSWKARQYLNSRLDKENQMLWKFGYFPDDAHLSDLTSMVSKADLEVLKLYYPKFLDGGNAPHGHFSDHNLVMPFYNAHREIVSILGRCLISEKERQAREMPKYNYSNGCRKDLFVYGLDKARDSIIKNDFVILTEGQFDCISLHNYNITNSIALGWANMSRYQFFQLHRYTNNFIVMLDNDEAGQNGKIKIKKKFENVCNIKTISPPIGYKDIDEFFRNCKDVDMVNYVVTMLGCLNVM